MYENRVLLKKTEAKQILIESIEFFCFSKNISFVRRDKKTTKNKKKEFQLSVPLTEAIRSKCELLSPQLLVNLCEF